MPVSIQAANLKAKAEVTDISWLFDDMNKESKRAAQRTLFPNHKNFVQ
jgi:hypothetical protein